VLINDGQASGFVQSQNPYRYFLSVVNKQSVLWSLKLFDNQLFMGIKRDRYMLGLVKFYGDKG